MSECKPRTGSHPTQGSHRRVKENGPFLDEGWQTGLLEATESIVRCPSVLLFRLMWASKRRESSLATTVFLQFLPPGETHPYTKGVLPRFLPSGNTRRSRLLSDSPSSSPETPKCISHPPPYTPHPHSRRTPIASRKTPLSSLTSIGCCHPMHLAGQMHLKSSPTGCTSLALPILKQFTSAPHDALPQSVLENAEQHQMLRVQLKSPH